MQEDSEPLMSLLLSFSIKLWSKISMTKRAKGPTRIEGTAFRI
jgi:hypothetical protein